MEATDHARRHRRADAARFGDAASRAIGCRAPAHGGDCGVSLPHLRVSPNSRRSWPMREGRLEAAAEELNAAIAETPADSRLRKSRAELRIQLDELTGAAEDAAEAVILEREDPVAKALLGTVLIGLGRSEEAVICLREAIAGAPTNPFFHQACGGTRRDRRYRSRRRDAGLRHRGLSGQRRACGTPRFCTVCGGRISRRPRPRGTGRGSTAWRMRACWPEGHSLSSLGRHEEAADAYADALKLGPDDPYVRHLVAASGALPGGERAPVDYLRAVFDGYAAVSRRI